MARERICVAIDPGSKNSAQVIVANYLCPATNRQVVVNNTMVPYSPYSGRSLKLASRSTVALPVREIRADLANVGDCPTCESSHYMYPREAKALKGKQLHCVVCNNVFPVAENDAADDTTQTDDDNADAKPPVNAKPAQEIVDQDNSDSEQVPEKINGQEDGEILRAAADDDDNDDDDNNDNDDNDNADADDAVGDKIAPAAVEITDPGAATPAATPPVPAATRVENPPAPADTELTDETGSADDNDNNDDDDDEDDLETSEIVSASAKELRIDCFARTGGFTGKRIQFLPVNAKLALILADDQPVISLEADKAGDNKTLFDDPEQLTQAVKAIIDNEENPTPASFAALGGAAITFTVPVADAIKQRIENGIKSVTAGFTEKRGALLNDMRQCLSMASMIIHKGIDRDLTNPLRDAIVAGLKKVNVRNADTLVEAAFIEASEPYIRAVLAKANELFDQPADTRNQMARFIERSPFAAVAATDSNEHREKFRQGSMPLMTTANSTDNTTPPPLVRDVNTPAETPAVQHYRQLLRR